MEQIAPPSRIARVVARDLDVLEHHLLDAVTAIYLFGSVVDG